MVAFSLDLYTATAAAVALPWVYFIVTGSTKSNTVDGRPKHRTLLNIVVLLHTLFVLYKLIISYPSNVFTLLRIPLNTPTESIRAILLNAAQGGDADHTNSPSVRQMLPEHLETLLKSLSSFDMRTLYVRFGEYSSNSARRIHINPMHDLAGHKTITECTYCRTFAEFGLFALARPLLAYIRTAVLLGIITLRGSRRERWRTMGVLVLICVAAVEAYYAATVEIRAPKPRETSTMWHDLLWTVRHVVFLVLPPLVNHVLPASPPRVSNELSMSAFRETGQALEQVMGRMQLLKYSTNAVQRLPELREKSTAWYEQRRLLGKLVREDELVQKAAESAGFGYHEGESGGPFMQPQQSGAPDIPESMGKLRQTAVLAIHTLRAAFAPSADW